MHTQPTSFKRHAALFISSLLLMTSLSACTKASLILTRPSGAKVYINGAYKGITPLTYHSSQGLPDRFAIKVEREGFQSIEFYIDKSPSLLPLLLTPLYGISILFNSALEGQYKIDLMPLKLSEQEEREAKAASPSASSQEPPQGDRQALADELEQIQ
jgi:hypothetical protein